METKKIRKLINLKNLKHLRDPAIFVIASIGIISGSYFREKYIQLKQDYNQLNPKYFQVSRENKQLKQKLTKFEVEPREWEKKKILKIAGKKQRINPEEDFSKFINYIHKKEGDKSCNPY